MQFRRTLKRSIIPTVLGLLATGAPTAYAATQLEIEEDDHIVLIGNGLGSRMMQYGLFETGLHLQHPKKKLFIRNMCDEGNTPGFRPHAARSNPWAFAGAERFHPPLSDKHDRWRSKHTGEGTRDRPDGWLTRLEADTVIAFFGFNESFNGKAGLKKFEGELTAFIQHTRAQKYNGEEAPQLALVSPIAFEDKTSKHGIKVNANLELYTEAMAKIAKEEDVLFVDLLTPSKTWFAKSKTPLTRDGVNLKKEGYQKMVFPLIEALFEKRPQSGDAQKVLAAVLEKNWVWEKFYKIPNGVHVYGKRHKPYGPHNYPSELKKLEEMTANRDEAIWATLDRKRFDLNSADKRTTRLPKIKTNYRPSKKNGSTEYLERGKALRSFTTAPGYKVELFASEKQFENLANPSQISFDSQGRLWVATMPSYPHYKPGDDRPSDKLIILEDTNNDGKADKETVFADDLHLPTGFELENGGVYVAQGNHLIFLKDTDGDDKADLREIVLSGFDDHDTHHVISAFCADPSGAIYMGEGTFLHSHIETAYGPVRSSNGGFFRYSPQLNELQRTSRISIPNPWGTAFDEYGQPFFLETSDPNMLWMTACNVNTAYGQFGPKPPSLIEKEHRVRPTSGLEFVSSRHFPDDVQGDILLNNTIGYLGTKQHQLTQSGSGYSCKHRQDLIVSEDGNYRPSDLEFAPDGSLYIADWHNVLIGHMQHSARDPLRDITHGRIYRITYPERPLVKPAKIHKAPLTTLFENLKLPESRSRYRTRRELRTRPADKVLPALQSWVKKLKPSDPRYEHTLLEALWVSWGLNQVDQPLLKKLIRAKDHRVRAAAVEVVRCNYGSLANASSLLKTAAGDTSSHVRLTAAAAASWIPKRDGLDVLSTVAEQKMDSLIKPIHSAARAHLAGQEIEIEEEDETQQPTSPLDRKTMALFKKGAEVYSREGHCITCHQPDGEGLPAAKFPPISNTKWIQGNPDRLIKLTMHGLHGPIEIKGKKYAGQVPMTAFKALSDDEMAAVLTYVRNTFGNKASAISADQVKAVRAATKDREGFYSPAELLEEHPHE